MVQQHDYINLDVTKLQSAEIDRKTQIGEELFKYATHDKIIPSSIIVRMLNKIVYCGQKKLNKFILSNFPEQIDQVKCFEEECAKISAIVYPTNTGATVEITQQELSMFNIESLFQKDFRLKTMNEWSFQLFNEKLGNKVEFGLISGKPLSGKTLASELLEKNHGFKVFDMDKIEEGLKATLGTEDEPFDGDVPLAEIEKQIVKTISDAKNAGGRSKFVFKEFKHETEDKFMKFIEQFGVPDFALFMTCEERSIKERWMKKNEAEDVPEETMDEIRQNSSQNAARRVKLCEAFNAFGDRS